MSTLPVLYSDTPRMQLCQICPKPGSCCNGFILNDWSGTVTFRGDDWQQKAEKFLQEHNLDFKVTGIFHRYEYGAVVPKFGCTHLTPEGRCGIYATRPQLCRSYKPMQDNLCCLGTEHKETKEEIYKKVMQ